MSEKQSIVLHLDINRVSLNVDRDQEHFYREAAAILNERFRHYQSVFRQLKPETIWAYAALDVAVQLQKQKSDMSIQPIAEHLEKLNEILIQTLEKDNNTKKE